jgi:hypothetical protein
MVFPFVREQPLPSFLCLVPLSVLLLLVRPSTGIATSFWTTWSLESASTSATSISPAAPASEVGSLTSNGLALEFRFLVLKLICNLFKREIFFLIVDNLNSSLVFFVHADFKELGKNLFREWGLVFIAIELSL